MVATVNGLVPSEAKAGVLERVLMVGDLSKLTPEDRISYYRGVCDSLGLNPFTRPFDYLSLNNRLVLYAKREAAEQLRKLHGVSIEKIEKEIVNGVYVVTAHAKDKDGRQDIGTGAVALGTLKGDALANAMMKAETKSKRRVTLSICGLGFLDESEIESVPDAQPANVDHDTGEIIESRKQPPELPKDLAKPETVARIMAAVTALAVNDLSGGEARAIEWLTKRHNHLAEYKALPFKDFLLRMQESHALKAATDLESRLDAKHQKFLDEKLTWINAAECGVFPGIGSWEAWRSDLMLAANLDKLNLDAVMPPLCKAWFIRALDLCDSKERLEEIANQSRQIDDEVLVSTLEEKEAEVKQRLGIR